MSKRRIRDLWNITNKFFSTSTVVRNRGNRWTPHLQPLEERTLLSGGLDLTFNGTGKQTVAFDLGATKFDQAGGLAIQSDGKVVLAGTAHVTGFNFDFAVTRVNADGTRDTGFGIDGKTTFGFSDDDGATGVAVQPDGKIIVVGSTDTSGDLDFVVARLNADGSTDTGFGIAGKRIIAFGGLNDSASGVALQPDGKIGVVGTADLGSNLDFAVARLNTDGSLDTSFGDDGRIAIGFGLVDIATGVAVQPDGKIVVAGSTNSLGNQDFVVARLKPDGTTDTLFNGDGTGNGGFRIIAFDIDGANSDIAAGVALQADGKIVLAGTVQVGANDFDFGLARLNPKGTMDTSWGGSGKRFFGLGLVDRASGIALQPDGKIVVAGSTDVAGNLDMVLSRVNANGILDAGFGTGGQRVIAFDVGGSKSDLATGIALRPDGKIVVAGSAEVATANADFAIARLEGANVHFLAVGGAPNRVQVFSRAGASLGTFSPLAGYNDAVAVAFGDVNSDGIDDLIVSATIGNPAVKIYSGATLSDGTFFINPESHALASGFAYGINFNVGANIAAGDVNGDGFADIITGAVPGNPHVKVFDGKKLITGGVIPAGDAPSVIAQGFAYGLGFNVGANVAAGDINGDGLADVITGASAGNPHTRVFDAKAFLATHVLPTGNAAGVMAEFFPYGLNFNVGSFVAVADYNRDGFEDVITGASVGNPEVRVFSGKDMAKGTFDLSGSLLDFLFAFEVDQNIGISVGASDFTGDGKADVVVGTRSGPPRVRVFRDNLFGPPTILPGFDVTDGSFSGGLYVGA